MKDSISPNTVRELAYGFQSSRILLTAYELSVFTALDDAKKSSGEVAAAIGTDPRATDRLMNALCAMDLLVKKNGRFLNAPIAARYLVSGKPDFMAGLMHTAHLWTTWATLTDAVRAGSAVAIKRSVNKRGDVWLSAFIAAMHDRASKQASGIVSRMDLSGVSRVLDVGGGSGAFAMAFAEANRGITATVFDLPNVIPLTKKYVKQSFRAFHRVKFRTGDYLIDDLGKDFDLVFLSAIVHSNSMNENRNLIKKCSTALRRHGQVVIQDFIMNKDRTSPTHGAFFALNMLVGTKSGDTYSESEVRSWMEEAGLAEITRQDTPYGTTQIIGKRID